MLVTFLTLQQICKRIRIWNLDQINHDFTSHGWLNCAILKAFYDFKVTQSHEVRDFKMRVFNMNFLRSSKYLKTTQNSSEQPVELTQKS